MAAGQAGVKVVLCSARPICRKVSRWALRATGAPPAAAEQQCRQVEEGNG